MYHRIDAFADHERTVDPLPAGILSDQLDGDLQRIVLEAASSLGCPMALVSLVLEKVQYFRAHCGLPSDLGAVRATSCDTSFCQFVVRDDAPFVVTDAAQDARVPQALVEQYGIRSYLGVPIRYEGRTLGSLCVIDVEPREFDDVDRARLNRLAQQVDQRLAALAADRPALPLDVISQALTPTIAELRNHLVPIYCGVEEARLSVFEIQTFVTALEGGQSHAFLIENLAPVGAALEHLRGIIDLMGASSSRILESVKAIEAVAASAWERPTIGRVIAEADRLARHLTRVIGGIDWVDSEAQPIVDMPLPIASAALASILGWLVEHVGRRVQGPVTGRVVPDDKAAIVELVIDGLEADDVLALYVRLKGCGLDTRRIRLDGRPPWLRIAFDTTT